jgi:predicted acetyltransferase
LETASGEILGYGWLADLQGEAEVSVVATVKGKGYGTKTLHNLEKEAKKLGYNRIVAVVQPENPCARDVLNWLFNNGYHAECFPVASQEMLIEAVKRIPISMIKYI